MLGGTETEYSPSQSVASTEGGGIANLLRTRNG